MKQLLTTLLVCLVSVASAQNKVLFGGSPRDTAYNRGATLLDGPLRMTAYKAQGDTTLIAVDGIGRAYMIPKSAISAWSGDAGPAYIAGYGINLSSGVIRIDTVMIAAKPWVQSYVAGQIAGIPAPSWTAIIGTPSTFPPSVHTHAVSELQQSGATSGQVIGWTGSLWAPVTLPSGDTTGKGLLARSAAAATYARIDSLSAKEARLNTRIDNIPAGGGGLTSIGLTMPSAFSVAGSPRTTNGNIDVTMPGTSSQYVRGNGSLGTFPTAVSSFSNDAGYARSGTLDTSRMVVTWVYKGESNSGGQALNSELTTAELQARRAVNILHNYQLQFVPLQIGVNNLIGHLGLTSATYHGWENGLAHEGEAGLYYDSSTYLIKTGQGGSRIGEWCYSCAYTDTFRKRITAANYLFQGAKKTPTYALAYSLGINDAIALGGALPYGGKDSFKADIIRTWSILGGPVPTYIPVFMSSAAGANIGAYNRMFDSIANEMPLVYRVPTADLAVYPDGNHWPTPSMDSISYRMGRTFRATFGQKERYVQAVAAALRSFDQPVLERLRSKKVLFQGYQVFDSAVGQSGQYPGWLGNNAYVFPDQVDGNVSKFYVDSGGYSSWYKNFAGAGQYAIGDSLIIRLTGVRNVKAGGISVSVGSPSGLDFRKDITTDGTHTIRLSTAGHGGQYVLVQTNGGFATGAAFFRSISVQKQINGESNIPYLDVNTNASVGGFLDLKEFSGIPPAASGTTARLYNTGGRLAVVNAAGEFPRDTFAINRALRDSAAAIRADFPTGGGGGTTYAAGSNITFTGSNPTTINATGTFTDPRIDSQIRARLYTVNCTWYGGPITATADGYGGFNISVPPAPFSNGGTTNWYGDNYLDGWSGNIPSEQALILDPRGNGMWSVGPSDFASVKSVTTRIPFIQVRNGRLYSPIPTVLDRLPREPGPTLYDIFSLHTDWVYATSQGRSPFNSITKAGADSWTFNIADAYFLSGNLSEAQYNQVSSYSGTLANGRALCFEFAPNGNVSIVNVVSYYENIRSNIKRVPIVFNSFGKLLSPSPVITEYINTALSVPVVIFKKVKANGTIGVDCDYTQITDAVNAITDASFYKRYVLDVDTGLYSTNTDLSPKDYIDIRGRSKEKCVLVGARVPASPGGVSTIYMVDRLANCTISNLTILGVEDQYAIHYDCPGCATIGSPSTTIFKNCIIRQYENRHAIGIGIYGNQELIIDQCEVGGRGIYAHNGNVSSTSNKPMSLKIISTQIPGVFSWSNAGTQMQGETITFENSTVGVLDLLSPATTNPYPNFVFKGSRFGATNYDANMLNLLGGKHLQIEGHNKTAYNTTGSTIPKGYAVVALPSNGNTIIYPSEETQTDRIAPYAGSGIFAGFAELDIPATSQGTIQISGNPQAYFNAAGGSVAYGDDLELSGSGQVQKRAGGSVVAVALVAASTNGLISVKMLDGKIDRAGSGGGSAPDSAVYQTRYQTDTAKANLRSADATASTNDRARANHTGTQDTTTILNLTSGLNVIRALVNGKANTSHTQDTSTILNLTSGLNVLRAAINGKQPAGPYLTSETDPVYTAAAPSIATLTGSQALINKTVNGVTLTTGGSTTAFLNAAGTYTTPAGGGGGSVDTSTPNTGVVTKYQLDTAKAMMRDEYMQMVLGKRHTVVGPLHANSGTTLQIGGDGYCGVLVGVTNATNVTGTNKSTAAYRTSFSSYQYSSGAVADVDAGIRTNFTGSLLSASGVYFRATIAFSSLPSDYRMMIGLRGGGGFTPGTDPSVTTSAPLCLFGKDAADGDIKVMTRATGSSTTTKTSTGITPTLGSIYEFIVDWPRGASAATFRIYENSSVTTRTLVYSASISATLPNAGQFMHPQATVNSGPTGTTAAIINFYKLLVTGDF